MRGGMGRDYALNGRFRLQLRGKWKRDVMDCIMLTIFNVWYNRVSECMSCVSTLTSAASATDLNAGGESGTLALMTIRDTPRAWKCNNRRGVSFSLETTQIYSYPLIRIHCLSFQREPPIARQQTTTTAHPATAWLGYHGWRLVAATMVRAWVSISYHPYILVVFLSFIFFPNGNCRGK